MKNIVDISEMLLLLGLSATCTETERAIVQASLVLAQGAVRRFLRYDPAQDTRIEYYPQTDFGLTNSSQVWETTENTAYLRDLSSSSSTELQLTHLPVRSIVSLKVDYDGRSGTRTGSFGASTAKTEGTDFWPNFDIVDGLGNSVCQDGIIRSEGLWPDQPGSIRIEYVAGYTEKEFRAQDSIIDASPIWEAVIDEVTRRVLKVNSRMKKRLAGFSGSLTSESLGDYSYSQDGAIAMSMIGGGMDLLPETEQKLQAFQRYDLGVM